MLKNIPTFVRVTTILGNYQKLIIDYNKEHLQIIISEKITLLYILTVYFIGRMLLVSNVTLSFYSKYYTYIFQILLHNINLCGTKQF